MKVDKMVWAAGLRLAVVAVLLCSTHIRVAEAVQTPVVVEELTDPPTYVHRITGKNFDDFLSQNHIKKSVILEVWAGHLNGLVFVTQHFASGIKVTDTTHYTLGSLANHYYSVARALTAFVKRHPSKKGVSTIGEILKQVTSSKRKSNTQETLDKWYRNEYVDALNLFVMVFLSSTDPSEQEVALTVIANVPLNKSNAKKFKGLVSSLDVGHNELLKSLKEKALSKLSSITMSVMQFVAESKLIKELYNAILNSQNNIMSSMVSGGKDVDRDMKVDNINNKLLESVFCLLYCVDVIGSERVQSDFNDLVDKYFIQFKD